jgi:glycosyltransferase involved in cell wall biosynthesis
MLRQLLYPSANLVVVQTMAAARLIQQIVPRLRRVAVIENPIPEELYATQRPSPPPARRRILGFGRLTAQKQFDHLIAIFSELAPRFPDVDLWIWGEGEARSELEAQARQSGLAARIFFPGRTDEPWVEMLAGDVLVLTSAYEGFPNVLLEAMALGVPCVAYDCPEGPRDLTRDGELAALVSPGDRQAMCHEISKILLGSEIAKERANRSAGIIRASYRLETIISKWQALLEINP